MTVHLDIKYVSNLFRFMLIFEINRFTLLNTSESIIMARIGWGNDGSPDYDEEDEVQDIEWDIQSSVFIEDALKMAEFLINNQLIHSDKIMIDKRELSKRIGWANKRFEEALKTLLDIRVDMVDEGKRTDYFFVHF
ncbi:MAG: hypothetical protein ACI8RA_002906 [Chlamydiales bacterium]|jgi:hypothetical protein